jgi:FkbM family methyltransferase
MDAVISGYVGDWNEDIVVFDIGAEEGDFPALFTKWGAKVHLFEPNPLVWPNIRAIFEANKMQPAGYFVGFAGDTTNLSPADIEPIIAQPDRDGWPACAYGELIGNHGFRTIAERSHDTPSITIDDYVAKTSVIPWVITIDVEGAELKVLKGAEHTLRNNEVDVFVSIHPEMMVQSYGTVMHDLMQYMHGIGYFEEYITFDHELHYHFASS